MALEVVDGRERQLAGRGEALGGSEADQQRADQARPARRGDERDVLDAGAGTREGLGHNRLEQFEMMARRDLGHDAPKAVVDLLRGDDVCVDRAVLADERRTGVVAARFDREDHGR